MLIGLAKMAKVHTFGLANSLLDSPMAMATWLTLTGTLCQLFLTRFNKIATQGALQMAVDKEANSLSRVCSYNSKFNLCLFYV